ncbi:MAG: stage II sporulation protein D [Firmicutes bacterium]|nr:stage II sporulation protein D [Bacillota bacterium]
MRRAALALVAIMILVIFLPAAVVSLARDGRLPQPGKQGAGSSEPFTDRGPLIRLYRTDLKQVLELELEDYLVGVVAAEMPASFELEALKAQAVASRTYTLRRCRSWGGQGCELSPEPADICSESTHCQAWLDPGHLDLGWPEDKREELLHRIKTAVQETAGEIATYRGEPIEAVYHSTCGGQTESSHGLWEGGQVPYLQTVPCPYCIHSPHYRTEKLISYQALADTLPGTPAQPVTGSLPVEITLFTPGDRVGRLKIGDYTLEGKELRNRFQLPSLACSFQVDSRGIRADCKGKGHGVGLCQYGADGAARQGQNYHQIIAYYYSGAEITVLYP